MSNTFITTVQIFLWKHWKCFQCSWIKNVFMIVVPIAIAWFQIHVSSASTKGAQVNFQTITEVIFSAITFNAYLMMMFSSIPFCFWHLYICCFVLTRSLSRCSFFIKTLHAVRTAYGYLPSLLRSFTFTNQNNPSFTQQSWYASPIRFFFLYLQIQPFRFVEWIDKRFFWPISCVKCILVVNKPHECSKAKKKPQHSQCKWKLRDFYRATVEFIEKF